MTAREPILQFRFEWPPLPGGTAAERTRGALQVWIRDVLVWGTRDDSETHGFEWTWIELLEHASRYWSQFRLEEMDPLFLATDSSRLRALATERWADVRADLRDREERALYAFEQRHDLAQAIQGAVLPSIWIQRAGERFEVQSSTYRTTGTTTQVLGELERACDAIASRIADCSDSRAQVALERWRRRKIIQPIRLVEIASSLSLTYLQAITGDDDPKRVWEIDAAGTDTNELMAAARMAGSITSPSVMRRLLDEVRKVPHGTSTTLEEISRRARKTLSPSALGNATFDEGYALAEWLRGECGSAPANRFEPLEWLSSYEVAVRKIRLDNVQIDAVAVWGKRHGPAVIVNSSGKHSQDRAGERTTLAHELCHILIDRAEALPLAEVLGGRLPNALEARARAFAAELLLPRQIAGERIADCPDVTSAAKQVAKLQKSHGVSPEVVAWQAKNSDAPIRPPVYAYLRSLVSAPGRF